MIINKLNFKVWWFGKILPLFFHLSFSLLLLIFFTWYQKTFWTIVIFISFYVFLSYFSISPSPKILGGIFIFSAFITFTAFSLIFVLTQILFFPILTGIANTELNSFNVARCSTRLSLFVCNRHQHLLFDFAVVTVWLNKMIISLSFSVFGDFDVHRRRVRVPDVNLVN